MLSQENYDNRTSEEFSAREIEVRIDHGGYIDVGDRGWSKVDVGDEFEILMTNLRCW